MQIDLRHRILKQGKDATQAYLIEQIALLRDRERTLLSSYGRPYCDQHYSRALHGKIGKVHGGYVAT